MVIWQLVVLHWWWLGFWLEMEGREEEEMEEEEIAKKTRDGIIQCVVQREVLGDG